LVGLSVALSLVAFSLVGISLVGLSIGDRGGVPDLLVSGDKSDFGVRRPSPSNYDEQARSANAIAEPTPSGYRPCWRKMSLITKINSFAQSTNEQEFEASNLSITRKWSSES
jgi:hypothetical protein